MTMPNELEANVATDKVLELAQQLSNGGSQSPNKPENEGEGRVPYDRFKEVNDERKALYDQNQKLMEMMQNFQQMQTNANAQAQQAVPAQTPVNTPAPLFTDEELSSFETDIVLDPKATLQKFGEAILNRGVESRVKSLEQTFEQKLQQITGQLTATTVPTVIAQFKQSRFGPQDVAEVAAFDQAIQGLDPSLLTNPQTLENVRLAAIGYVADQRRANPTQGQHNQQAFFTETPGGAGLPGGWGGLGGQPAQPQVPQQVLLAAQKMGVSAEEAAAMYSAMNTSGVFRG